MPRTRARARPRTSRRSLPAALQDALCQQRGVDDVQVVETHVSWVFLTGRYAYKVKKPVKLPFVDFSTLRRREHYCREELRINRRLAPDVYLAVVPIGGSPASPRLGRTPAFEYAVKMREFPADARLDRQLAAARVPKGALAELGVWLATFHGRQPPVRRVVASEPGASALRNVTELARLLGGNRRHELALLRTWTEQRSAKLAAVFERRAAAGAHRECHGDLHLQNLLCRDGKIIAFDALEFDRKLREIDVVSEVAFLAMDLRAHGHPDLACELVNAYLETGGDYAGVDVLEFYLVYRALVRAKVAAIKQAQSAADGHDADRYLATALELTSRRKPLLVITHGLSGSGKTSISGELVSRLPGLRVRSDVERKRLHGLEAAARSGSRLGGDLYSAAATRRTYESLAAVADALLRNGQTALVDAAFLRRAERRNFRQVAAFHAARFVILDCTARPDELRRRIRARARAGRDASEADVAVLEQQLRTQEGLDAAERRAAVTVDTEREIAYAQLAARIRTA